jgi:hypothetical protein
MGEVTFQNPDPVFLIRRKAKVFSKRFQGEIAHDFMGLSTDVNVSLIETLKRAG